MPAPMIARLGEIALKEETTKGTKVAMTLDGSEAKFGVFNAVWTTNPEFFDREILRSTLSAYPHLVGQVLAQCTFDIEVRKTAVLGTEDAWGPLFRSCGLSFTAGSGRYAPKTDTAVAPCITLYAYRASLGTASNNTLRFGMRGAAAGCKLFGETGKPMMFRFTVIGSHDPADATLLPQTSVLHTITHEAAIAGIFQGITCTWNGYSAKIKSFEFDLGNQVVPRDDATATNGIAHFVAIDRKPMITLDPELTIVSEQDWWNQLNVGTEVAVAFNHSQPAKNGVTARNVVFAAPKAQIVQLTHGERNGMATMGLVAKLNGSVEPGDDEFTLDFTGS